MTVRAERELRLYREVLTKPRAFFVSPLRNVPKLRRRLRDLWQRGQYPLVSAVLRAIIDDESVHINNRLRATQELASYAVRKTLSGKPAERQMHQAEASLRWAIGAAADGRDRIGLLDSLASLLYDNDPDEAVRSAAQAVRILRDRLASARRRRRWRLRDEYAQVVVMNSVHILRRMRRCPRLLDSLRRELPRKHRGMQYIEDGTA